MNICKYDSPYVFDTDENGFPTFTKKNMEFLNGIARYDFNYSTATDENEKKSPEYQNSYAGLLECPDFDFFRSFDIPEDELGGPKDILYKVIESIDKLNSTHLASEGNRKKDEVQRGGEKRNKGREKVAAKIREIGGGELKRRLEKGDAALVEEIADQDVGGKHNFSFASKFCSYVSIHALGQDKYCIYDEILQSVLPYYAWMYIDKSTYEDKYFDLYKTKKRTGINESIIYLKYKERDKIYKTYYAEYRELIDEIIKGVKREIGEEITYTDFDRMLWYYFKGAKSRVYNAMSKLPPRK